MSSPSLRSHAERPSRHTRHRAGPPCCQARSRQHRRGSSPGWEPCGPDHRHRTHAANRLLYNCKLDSCQFFVGNKSELTGDVNQIRRCSVREPETSPSSRVVGCRCPGPVLAKRTPLAAGVPPPVSEGTETTGATGAGPRPPPATRDPPTPVEVARSSTPSRASSSSAATPDLSCGSWEEPMRGGALGTGDPDGNGSLGGRWRHARIGEERQGGDSLAA
jgi:hypothetical protein